MIVPATCTQFVFVFPLVLDLILATLTSPPLCALACPLVTSMASTSRLAFLVILFSFFARMRWCRVPCRLSEQPGAFMVCH